MTKKPGRVGYLVGPSVTITKAFLRLGGQRCDERRSSWKDAAELGTLGPGPRPPHSRLQMEGSPAKSLISAQGDADLRNCREKCVLL